MGPITRNIFNKNIFNWSRTPVKLNCSRPLKRQSVRSTHNSSTYKSLMAYRNAGTTYTDRAKHNSHKRLKLYPDLVKRILKAEAALSKTGYCTALHAQPSYWQLFVNVNTALSLPKDENVDFFKKFRKPSELDEVDFLDILHNMGIYLKKMHDGEIKIGEKELGFKPATKYPLDMIPDVQKRTISANQSLTANVLPKESALYYGTKNWCSNRDRENELIKVQNLIIERLVTEGVNEYEAFSFVAKSEWETLFKNQLDRDIGNFWIFGFPKKDYYRYAIATGAFGSPSNESLLKTSEKPGDSPYLGNHQLRVLMNKHTLNPGNGMIVLHANNSEEVGSFISKHKIKISNPSEHDVFKEIWSSKMTPEQEKEIKIFATNEILQNRFTQACIDLVQKARSYKT